MNKKVFKRIIIVLLAVYAAIFAVRVTYEFLTFREGYFGNISYSNIMDIGSNSVRNYASEKMVYYTDGAQSVLDQKYERIANITSKTAKYDEDYEQFGALLEEYNAVLQTENRRGLRGERRAELVIGVRPESFDDMEAALLAIGKITSSNTTKIDKTYDFRQMLAEKETLEHRLNSYNALKLQGGSISELIQLEDKIIEVQSLIQQQMIGLGEFSDENALCTINFTLYEGSETVAPRIIWSAMQWSFAVYMAVLLGLLLVIFAAFMLLQFWKSLTKNLADKTNGDTQ